MGKKKDNTILILRNNITILPSDSVNINANLLQAGTYNITGRWHVEIHTALEKCNNIVLCVDRSLSLKGALIFRHVSCLFCTVLWSRYR